MPQARSGGGRRSSSSGGTRSGRSTAARSTSSRSSGTTRKTTSRASSSRSTAGRAKSTRAKSSTAKSSTAKSAGARATSTRSAADARAEAVAQRLRKLNDRIIEASKEAGEATLSSYERALRAIATTIEKGPGSSDIEWVSNLATAQAKFIRDLTTSWTKQARKALK
jgi:hypothetical protein